MSSHRLLDLTSPYNTLSPKETNDKTTVAQALEDKSRLGMAIIILKELESIRQMHTINMVN